MARFYHAPQSRTTQLSLFPPQEEKREEDAPRKQCSMCSALYPATLRSFHPNKSYSDGLNSACRDCRKESSRRSAERARAKKRGEIVPPIERKPPPMVSLICTICGKEFQRERCVYADNMREGRILFSCSPACRKKKDLIPLPDSIQEQSLEGALLRDIASHYDVSMNVIRRRLTSLGIPLRSRGAMNTLRGSPMKGKTHTKAARQQISEAQIHTLSDPEKLEAMRQRTLKQMSEGNLKASSSRLEDQVALELTIQGYTYTRQYPIYRKGHRGWIGCVDFRLSDGRGIEVNGTDWHCDPRKYPNGPKNTTQQQAIARHSNKMNVLAEQGIPVIELWEIDLTADLEGTIKRALG